MQVFDFAAYSRFKWSDMRMIFKAAGLTLRVTLISLAIGYLLGSTFESFITAFDHWIAFILLGFIGFNMIKGFFEDRKENNESKLQFSATLDVDDLSNKEIIMLAIATSIDALVTGITFSTKCCLLLAA